MAIRPNKTIQSQFNESLKRQGVTCTVDGLTATVVLKEIAEQERQDSKYLYSPLYASIGHINQGAVVIIEGNSFITIQKEVCTNGCYDKTIIRLCNGNIKFNYSGTIKSTPAICENPFVGTEDSRTLIMANGKLSVTLPNNADNRLIQLNQRFIAFGHAFKIEGIDSSRLGLIRLSCVLDAISATDDMTNEIAGGLNIPKPEPTPPAGEITISGNLVLKDKATNVYTASEPVTWTVDNKDTSVVTPLAVIVSQDTNTCSVKRNDSLTSNIGKYIVLTATSGVKSKSVDVRVSGLF